MSGMDEHEAFARHAHSARAINAPATPELRAELVASLAAHAPARVVDLGSACVPLARSERTLSCPPRHIDMEPSRKSDLARWMLMTTGVPPAASSLALAMAPSISSSLVTRMPSPP